MTSSWREKFSGIPRTPRVVPINKKSVSSVQGESSSGYEQEAAVLKQVNGC